MNLYVRYLGICLATLATVLVVAFVGTADVLRESPSAVASNLRYIAISGALALSVGVFGLSLGMRFLPRLSLKVAVAYAIASLGAILTVAYTPLLMFKDPGDLHLLVLLLVCFSVISLGLGSIIALGLAQHLRALRQAARRVAEGRFDTRVQVPSRDELSELGDAFNRMSAELGVAFERQNAIEQGRRDLVASISHDLRTPLASIRAMVEALEDGVVRDPQTTEQYHAAMLQQVDRLSRLIDELFELSRLDSGPMSLRLQQVDLNELVLETVDSLRPTAIQQGVQLNLAVPSAPLTTLVDADRLQRVIANLVQNAIRHTPEGGTIKVSVRSAGQEVAVEVIDSGEGIGPKEAQRVFDRFYRGEKARTAGDSTGAGLGLTIAKAIVEAHQGRIWVDAEPRQGARFVFTLPALGT